MNLSDAIAFWVTENGYRQIQTVFSRRIHKGVNTYLQTNLLESNTLANLIHAEEAIDTLREAMEPGTKRDIFYRGDSGKIRQTHLREGFFSVTRDQEKAAEYGKVIKVILEKEVPRLEFQAEGGEILVKDGMKYTIRDDIMYVSVPITNNTSMPYLGSLYQSKKTANNKQIADKLNKMINNLYCFSFEIPDEYEIYIGDCEESIKTEFAKLPFQEKLQKLRDRLNEMPYRKAFLESAPLLLGIDEFQLQDLLKEVMQGGHQQNRRKTRRRGVSKRYRKTRR